MRTGQGERERQAVQAGGHLPRRPQVPRLRRQVAQDLGGVVQR
ncbi:hypothetical protein [Streptomyces fodineus]|nr:hypothetical protein [Streptomyces fodineus]